ncbi:PREDICTED: diacylglycerol kinase [Prunus dulcis]|uniref:PREDICTED: diacylglycerol kinase n=1 Tax=Prunus dulcis TaxID=3755 RepID=A0A5E4FXF7_PRUDU|nr:PREDICTED: diacylglycerol kinase [Prunus dulcis]
MLKRTAEEPIGHAAAIITDVLENAETNHVGLSRARRLAQGESTKIHLFAALPVQAFMLKRTAEEPIGHAAAIITDVLENAETNHVISAVQKRALLQEMALRLT